MSYQTEPSSFRDPDGYVFFHGARCYRAIRKSYATTWEKLMQSGLYHQLVETGKIISVSEPVQNLKTEDHDELHSIVEVPHLPLLSYPPEWTFRQLKEAALLSLDIQRESLKAGFSLKDASAYNVQFNGHKALFIDSLSFEFYQEGRAWQAYGQFCRHFLAPLLLSHYGFPELRQLLLIHPDGIPLGLCSRLLPLRSKLNFFVATHLHLHASMEARYASSKPLKKLNIKFPKSKLLALVEHLHMGISGLEEKVSGTVWKDYYKYCSYTDEDTKIKEAFVKEICLSLKGKLCIDLGANEGLYTQIAAEHFSLVLACDADALALKVLEGKKIVNVICLQTDLGNPLPAYGWNSRERKSFIERVKHNDLCLALALIHHLCISNNLPFEKVVEFFKEIAATLLIEFVPREDPQVQRLLVSREDIFPWYNRVNFEKAFLRHYTLVRKSELKSGERVLYHFSRNV
ncbi:MAG TPA: SAM-dependent methyltransferase [Bacteroidia bacterium]|nr:SAM-dependent methyltransferase [Bacteroidia bacterium]